MGDEWLARAVKGQAAKEGSPGGGRQGKVARGRSPREGWQGEVGGSFKGPLGDLGLFSRGRQGVKPPQITITCVYINVMCVYIYIYIEKEREREMLVFCLRGNFN